ncbi:MAG: polyprenyl synthetase family protein [Mycobacterium sp.]|nr:polyprenyl synthetase family protein [Mycobacterium sp.]
MARTSPYVAPDAGWVLLRRAQCECDPVLRTAVGWLGEPLATMAGYHLGWDVDRSGVGGSPGKSARAALVMGAAAACGDKSAAAPAAAAVELMHNFSLVHDDVMDESVTRRGRPTVWAVWGETRATLLGDALHALAGRVLAEMLEPAVAMRAVQRLESACLAMCVGQLEDCTFETRLAVTVDEYLRMAAGKTAELMGCACALGALTAGADIATVSAMEQFGYQLGLAFQIVDDVMGIWGDPTVTGKPVGHDLSGRKATLPVVAALNSSSAAGVELAQLYRSAAPMTAAGVARATELVEAAGGRRDAQRHADQRIRAAMMALPDPARSEDLIAVAQLMVDRDR